MSGSAGTTPGSTPLNCDPDAQRWAREFMEVWNKNPAMDEGWMLSWFANAIMCGQDTMRWEMERKVLRGSQSETAAMFDVVQLTEARHYRDSKEPIGILARAILRANGEMK